MSHVAGLVLAAGFSRRFGSDKRRALLDGGNPLLATAVANARAVLPEVWVVLRLQDKACELGLAGDVQLVRSESSERGMGHSLASGAAAIARQSSAEALAVFLGDMPWLRPPTLALLLGEASAQRIIVPVHGGQPGHPVIFGRQFWPALLRLSGDSGARAVLQAHPHAVQYIAVDDPGVLRDVDTAADLTLSPPLP